MECIFTKKIEEIIKKIVKFQNNTRHYSKTFETKEGYRYKKECISCKYFSSDIEQYKKEIGNCKYIGIVSEWATCKAFKIREPNYKL